MTKKNRYCKPTIICDNLIARFTKDELVRDNLFSRPNLIYTGFFIPTIWQILVGGEKFSRQ